MLWSITRYTPLSSCRHSCSTTVSLGADRAAIQLRGWSFAFKTQTHDIIHCITHCRQSVHVSWSVFVPASEVDVHTTAASLLPGWSALVDDLACVAAGASIYWLWHMMFGHAICHYVQATTNLNRLSQQTLCRSCSALGWCAINDASPCDMPSAACHALQSCSWHEWRQGICMMVCAGI